MPDESTPTPEIKPVDGIQQLLAKYLPELDDSAQLRVATELVQLHAVREARSGAERKSSEVKVEFGGMPIVEVGPLTKQNAEALFEKVQDSIAIGDFGFNINLYPFLEQFFSGGDQMADKNVQEKVVFHSKKHDVSGEITIGWTGSNLTVVSAELKQSAALTNKLYDDPDGTTGLLQTAVESLATELRKYSPTPEEKQDSLLTEQGWQYALSEIRAPIHVSNERNAAEKKRQQEIFAEYLTKADEFYAFFLECLEAERPGLLADSVQSGDSESEYWDREKWKELLPQMRENCLRHVANIIQLTPSEFDLTDPELRAYIKRFISNAQIGHNRTEIFGIQDAPPRLIASQNARDLVPMLNLHKKNEVYLPCSIFDPQSESGKRDGTGWTGDTCYVFSLEEMSARALVMVGDIDQPSHEASVQVRMMTLADALLPAALFAYKHEVTRNLSGNREYDETMILGVVDFAKDAKRSFKLSR